MYNSDLLTEGDGMDLTYKQIHYYSNLPTHIKLSSDLTNNSCAPYDQYYSNNNPTFLINGTTTVLGGKLNIPSLDLSMQYNENNPFLGF